MLGPHLTAVNLVEVLARAKHRTKKEIAELVRALSPLPDVPPRIQPLGPAPASPARERTSRLAAESAPTSEQEKAFEQLPAAEQLELPAQRGRYVPAATRRAVFERDLGFFTVGCARRPSN